MLKKIFRSIRTRKTPSRRLQDVQVQFSFYGFFFFSNKIHFHYNIFSKLLPGVHKLRIAFQSLRWYLLFILFFQSKNNLECKATYEHNLRKKEWRGQDENRRWRGRHDEEETLLELRLFNSSRELQFEYRTKIFKSRQIFRKFCA